MGHVHHQLCPNRLCDLSKLRMRDFPWVGTGTRHDHLGAEFFCQAIHLIEIDSGSGFSDAVRVEIKQDSRLVQPHSMGQVAAVRQIKPQNRIPRRQEGEVDRLIRLRARVRLDVGMLRPKQFFCPVSRNIFNNIDVFAATVLPSAGIPFRIFIGQYTSDGLHHSWTRVVLAGDHLQARFLPTCLLADGFPDFRILTL